MSVTDDLLSGKTTEAVAPKSDTLTDSILSSDDTGKAVEKFNSDKFAASNRAAFVRGLRDVLDSASHGLGNATSYVADKVLPESVALPIRNSVSNMIESDKADRDKYDLQNPKNESVIPSVTEGARTIGQIAATAPLTPMRAMTAIKSGMGALPVAGQAAPILNRVAASSIVGGATGAEYGALTSSANDKSTLENAGEGLITGAIAGPALTLAAAGGKGLLPTVKNLWANVKINKIAEKAGLEPTAVKNIIDILQNAGYSPQEAQIALNKMGPQATLGDLASSIQNETGGLASIGGRPSEILKGRYEARAKTANSEAHNIMESKLGPKPDIEAEKEAIIKQAQKDTSPDYKAAHATSVALDIQGVVDSIDKQLQTAVGPKAAALKQLKGYLYKTGKDTAGNDIPVLKHRVDELHEVRQAIDDVINDKNPTTSYGKNALNSIKDVRSGVDEQLKTVPEIASADAKFADKMEIVNHIKIGEDILKRGMNKAEFARFYDGLTPDKQAAVKKGMRAAIGDAMEFATRGELSEAQRLFGKSSTNRANLEKVFGNNGTETLDALEKEAMFRGTENSARGGSQTAEKQSIQRKYGERNDGGGGLKDIIQGSVLDAVTGTPGAATAIMTAKRMGGHITSNISEGRKARLIEGTADLISRQGISRDVGLTTAESIKAVQDSLKKKSKLNFKLPTKLPTYLLSAPVGELGYSSYKNIGKE